jgi:hypothetical protein
MFKNRRKRTSKVRLSLGWVSAVDSQGRTIWIADAHRHDGKRFASARHFSEASEKINSDDHFNRPFCAIAIKRKRSTQDTKVKTQTERFIP